MTEFNSDYSYIINGDTIGIYNKHIKYINHYARSLARNSSDKEDIKQDLTVEMLNLLEWIKPEKLNENFNIKYYLFQKFNAYRKSQKHVKQNIFNKVISTDAQETKENGSYYQMKCTETKFRNSNPVYKNYLTKHDFPENELNNKIDRQIYFSKFIYNEKIKDICSDLNMNYTTLMKRIAHIENKLRNYIEM